MHLRVLLIQFTQIVVAVCSLYCKALFIKGALDSSQTCRKVDIIRHTQLSSQYRLIFKIVTP